MYRRAERGVPAGGKGIRSRREVRQHSAVWEWKGQGKWELGVQGLILDRLS